MSKIKADIHKVLADGKWHSTYEILERVSRSACAPKKNVLTVLHTLTGGHHIVKAHISYSDCRYRAGTAHVGFGISPNMAEFQSLLDSVRGGHAPQEISL